MRTRGAEPLITAYDVATDARTELSATSFANWVDKTAHLLLADDVEPGDLVRLSVAASAPGHWMTAVWCAAVWQVGAVVDLSGPDAAPPVVEVVGPPTGGGWPQPTGWPVWACSLHPLGMGFPVEPPSHVGDYALEVRAQPDSHVEVPVAPTATAVITPTGTLDGAAVPGNLATSAHGGRRLVRPDLAEPWGALRAVLVAPVVTGGSVVAVFGGDDAAMARIRATENAG